MLTKHHILHLTTVGLHIMREIEEKWPVESATFFVKIAHFGVVVVDEGQFHLHGVSDELNVAVCREYCAIEHVWLLCVIVKAIVIARKWIESANVVPLGA